MMAAAKIPTTTTTTTTVPLTTIKKCHDCNIPFTLNDSTADDSMDDRLAQSSSNASAGAGAISKKDKKIGSRTSWWWCRDCTATLCGICYLMNGHTEHRGGEWRRQELYRSTMQALEGRCSTRSNLAKEFEMQIREFTATLECHLVDLLQKRLEELNEPDRLLISRLNRALCELGDSNSSVLSRPMYHMLSPTRPAHRVWTMCTKEPERLKNLLSEVCQMANITYDNGDECNSCDVKFSVIPPSAWSAADCAKYLLEKSEAADDMLSERRARHFGSYRSMKNGFSLMKSASSSSQRSTNSLPADISPDSAVAGKRLQNDPSIDLKQFSELPKEKLDPEKLEPNGQLPSELGKTQLPLEPSVLIRSMKKQNSFRESSLTDESDSACALKEEHFNSTSPSATSSNPVYQTDTSYDSRDLQAPLCEQTISSCGPSTSTTMTQDSAADNTDCPTTTQTQQPKEPIFLRFGRQFLTRPIDVIPLPNIFDTKKQLLAVSDSCGGVYIMTCTGEVVQHLPIRDSSASSLTIDPTGWRLLVSVMHSQGRSIHMFDMAKHFKKVEVIPCPKEPKIELSRTRWITVSPRGEIFAVSGDNHRSAVWMYNRSRKGWKVLKESRKTRYQYLRVAEDQPEFKAVVLLTCDAAQNRILLFIADYTGTIINEYDLTETYHLDEHIKNPASAVVDYLGNLLVLDYATSRLWVLLHNSGKIRHVKEIVLPNPLGAQEALGICAHSEWIYVTCFARRELLCIKYLENGSLARSCCAVSTPETQPSDRRAISLPRPSRKTNQV